MVIQIDNNSGFNIPPFVENVDKSLSFVKGNDVVYPEHSMLLHEIFEAQAKKTPENIAVFFKGHTLTYRELNDQANRLATHLRKEFHILPDDCVGIYMSKSIEYVISYIAILKAGGAYSPVDRSYPTHLLHTLLENSNLKLIISDTRDHAKTLPEWQKVFCFDDVESGKIILDESMKIEICPRDEMELSNLAYIVFSGGSTGVPKSIICPHMGAVQSYVWRERLFPTIEGDREACNVFFVWELLRPLLKGFPMYIIPDETIYDPQQLADFIYENKITRILFTPSLLQAVLDMHSPEEIAKKFESIRLIWLCGEVVSMALNDQFKSIFPQKKLLNLYSVSECHDVSAADIADLESDREYASTGFVADNVQIYILNEKMEIVPKGEQGELYVGGVTLAREYYKLPERNRERFVPNPFFETPIFPQWKDNRLYKTGDWARILPDGSLEIRGRCDSMVKIRGYSVELSTVEAILSKHPDITAAVAGIDDRIIQESDGQRTDRVLVSWVVLSRDDLTGNDIRMYLKKELPHYMIPDVILRIDSLPIHPVSGKLEKKRLPSAEEHPERILPHGVEIIPPRTPSEERLHALVKSILSNYELEISIHDEFQDIGGTSLRIANLYGLIQKDEVWGCKELVLSDIYNNPTIALLATLLDHRKEEKVDLHEEVKLSFPESIQPQTKYNYSKDLTCITKNILLTGVTGFLGAFLLKELLNYYPEAIIHCIVRGDLERVTENLRSYRLWDASIAPKIRVINGSLDRVNFGLDNDTLTLLSQELDLIIHNGASVNFTNSYELLKGPNVTGTTEIIKLSAMRSEPIPIYYVSTNGVYATPLKSQSKFISLHKEEEFCNDPTQLATGYEESKWVAEKIVHEAIRRGFPIVIFRPGDICGHSETGDCNINHDFVRLLQGVTKLKSAPCDARLIDITPVDYVARAIVSHKLENPATSQYQYNLVHQEPIRIREIMKFLQRDLGYEDLEIVPPKEWISRLKATRDEKNPLVPLWPVLESTLDRSDAYFECTKFRDEVLPDPYETIEKMVINLIRRGLLEIPAKYPLFGKSAIITGCSSGIGKKIALELSSKYVNVVIAARREDRLLTLQKRIEKMKRGECVVQATDVTNRTAVAQLASKCIDSFSKIDILVNCSGIMPSTLMKNALQDLWDQTLNVNVNGVLNCIAAVLPHMEQRNFGDILTVTSNAGREPFESLAVYSGSKFAVEAIIKATRKELYGKNIRFMSIQPGDVRTELLESHLQPDQSEGVYTKDMFVDQILEPEDIAKSVYFQLCQRRSVGVHEILIEPTGVILTPEEKEYTLKTLVEKDEKERLLELSLI